MPNTPSKVILLAVPGDEAAGGWPVPFDETVVGDAMTLAGRYDAIVQADHLTRPPLAQPGTRLGFLVGDLDSLERLRGMALPGDVLFQPSALARLDRHRRARRTLVSARALTTGSLLARADLVEETGGQGIDASLAEAVIGRRLLYDLASGQPVDFGMLAEEKDP